MKPIIGYFIVYCACGASISGAQADFGEEDDENDGGMLMFGLREGRSMEYIKAPSPKPIQIGGRCGCYTHTPEPIVEVPNTSYPPPPKDGPAPDIRRYGPVEPSSAQGDV